MNESKEQLLNKNNFTCDDGRISLLLGRDAAAAAAAAEGLSDTQPEETDMGDLIDGPPGQL